MSHPRVLPSLPAIAAAYSAGTGLVVLAGWAFGLFSQATVPLQYVSMKANAAACFALAGASLWLHQDVEARERRLLARACGAVVALVGALTVLEHVVLAVDLGIDQLLFRDVPGPAAHPGRMAPVTAANFAVLGAALVAAGTARRRVIVAQVLSLMVGLIGLLGLLGYLYAVPMLYRSLQYTMALPTSVAFIVCSVGVLALRADRGVVAVIASDSAAGSAARRLLPWVFAAPMVIGWAALEGQRAGLYDIHLGIAWMVFGSVVVFSIVVWANAYPLHRLEERYRALMEQANDSILIMDLSERILEVNHETERVLGRPREEIVGRSYEDFVAPEEREEVARWRHRLLADGAVRVESRQLVRADGRRVSVEVSGSVVHLGEESMLLAILHDITERQRAEEAVRRSEARMKSVVDAALDAAIMMDAHGTVVSWNARAETLFGWARDEAVGRMLSDLIIPPRYREAHERGLKRFLATGEGPVIGRRIELSALRRDGAEFPVELTVTVLQEGGAFLFSAFVADITERKRAEQEIAERMKLAAFTADVGVALIRDEPLPVVLQQCAEAMMRHLEPAFARIWTLSAAGDTLELQASAGMYTHLDGAHARVPVGQFKIGLIAAEREPHLTNDVIHDPRVSDQAWARREGMVAFAGYPLVVGDQLVGVMAMFSRHPLSPNVLGSMAAVANQIALGIKRKRSEEEHRASEEQYRLLFDANPHPMWVFDQESFAFLAINDAAVRHYGYSREEFLAMTVKEIRPPEEVSAFLADHEKRRADPAGSYQSPHTWKHRKKDGTVFEVEIATSPIILKDRRARLTLVTDVTAKRSLESQLLQSQKIESMGRLAAGVAHDFNNLLGVISGYGELLRKRVAADPRLARYVDDIMKAAERAAGLTRQLLAFSRKQVLQPRILDLNAVVGETEKMLRRLIGEDVQLMTVFGEHLGSVRVDPGQVEQVLMNLAVNARDAMPHGGRLTIETSNVQLDTGYACQHPGVQPGSYAMLAVSDTGHGMTPEVLARAFEPFFTTKEPGKGTGLGLATVHGIVKQSGGHVWVYSEPAHGTTFKIYLPQTDGPAVKAEPPAPSYELPRGSETILLVEDEASLRELVRECLEASGYVVLEAGHGADALEISERHAAPVHLLMTDVVMPGMNGRALAERLRASRPEIRILYMSGYTDDAVVLHGVLAEDMAFLQKPFTAEALARTVREVLDRTPGSNPSP